MEPIEIEAIATLGAWYERYKSYEREMPTLQRVFLLLDELGCGRVLLKTGEWAIYALLDPRNQAMRYIGVTKHPERRWAKHNGNGQEANLRKQDWIADLKGCGLRPIMKTLEIVQGQEEARAREAAWIGACVNAGIDLLNVASLHPAPPPPTPVKRMPEEERQQIVELHQQGMPPYAIVRAIGKAAGYTQTVKKIIGEEMGGSKVLASERETILALHAQGLPAYAIARELHKAASYTETIKRIIAEEAIP